MTLIYLSILTSRVAATFLKFERLIRGFILVPRPILVVIIKDQRVRVREIALS